MAVDPGRRSRGLGRRLLETARTWAREQGATMLLLDSSTARIDAHRFYRREPPAFEALCFGWRLCDQRPLVGASATGYRPTGVARGMSVGGGWIKRHRLTWSPDADRRGVVRTCPWPHPARRLEQLGGQNS